MKVKCNGKYLDGTPQYSTYSRVVFVIATCNWNYLNI